MTHKIEINPDSLITFLKATHNDLLTMNVALNHGTMTMRKAAVKVNRHRMERVREVLNAIESGSELITRHAIEGEGV